MDTSSYRYTPIIKAFTEAINKEYKESGVFPTSFKLHPIDLKEIMNNPYVKNYLIFNCMTHQTELFGVRIIEDTKVARLLDAK